LTTLRRGHSLDLIEGIAKKSLDLLATDPPYAFGGRGAEHALSATVATVLRESAYRLKPGGWAVIFCASSWRSTFYMVEATRGILDPIRTGTWAKPVVQTKVRTPGWAWATVNVLVMRRPGGDRGLYKPPDEAASDFIVEPVIRNGRRAQLPMSVARWAVQPYALEGGTMLDPFAGSGALVQAAKEAGMDALGFEIEEAPIPEAQEALAI
jgi:site-specific DNA-methyltransferase (adenine-specific)